MGRNKAHKQRFSSNHALAGKTKGRPVGSHLCGVKAIHPMQAKERRLQAAVAHRKKKMTQALQLKRIGGSDGIPRVVGVVPANESGNTDLVVRGLCQNMGAELPDTCFPFTVTSRERKTAFTFMTENNFNLQYCVDVAKVSDLLVLVLDTSQSVQDTIRQMQETPGDVDEEYGAESVATTTWFHDVGLCITDFTRELIATINAQGVPSVVVVLQNLDTFSKKQQHKVLKVHQRYFLSVLPDETKVVSVVEDSDYDSLLRHLQVTRLRPILWREQHPYLVAEHGAYLEEHQKLVIGGYLRGMPLSAKQLIHITNHGTYQIESISLADPNDEDPQFIDVSRVEQREPLDHIQANATLDETDGPTEEDVAYHQSLGVKKVRVPEGVSEYQAAWYELEEEVGSASEHAEGEPPLADGGQYGFQDDELAASDLLSRGTSRTAMDFLKAEDIVRLERMTDEERAAEVQRLREESEEEAWNPDMVDTPFNLSARQRFAKYRGLKSFQASKWDPTENLPHHYAYIYKLQAITRIREAALSKCAEGPAAIGQYVYITLVGVTKDAWQGALENGYIIASGQLEHEQKWSVLHFKIQRSLECTEAIKSKSPMLAHIGFRKFYVSPLFSNLTMTGRTKMERFFQPSETFCMASFFGPISYQPCPLLLFEVPSLEEQREGDSLHMMCFGSAMPPNPDTLILKRVVLTGRVAAIHKKQIVVKYMFFNEEDVRWFQPVDLRTRLGRCGKLQSQWEHMVCLRLFSMNR
ncbi:hypothetical protein TRVL_00573 [Trypanosoma vivax]|nr:hypothetical protein TRVL_00573 [Trypanosoma vivax]